MSQPTDPATALMLAAAAFGDARYRAGQASIVLGPDGIDQARAEAETLQAALHDLIRSTVVYDPTGLHKLVDELLGHRAAFTGGDRTAYASAQRAAQQLAASGRRAETDLADQLRLLDRNTGAADSARRAAARNRRTR